MKKVLFIFLVLCSLSFVSSTEMLIRTSLDTADHGVVIRFLDADSGGVVGTAKAVQNYGTGLVESSFDTGRSLVDLLVLVTRNGDVEFSETLDNVEVVDFLELDFRSGAPSRIIGGDSSLVAGSPEPSVNDSTGEVSSSTPSSEDVALQESSSEPSVVDSSASSVASAPSFVSSFLNFLRTAYWFSALLVLLLLISLVMVIIRHGRRRDEDSSHSKKKHGKGKDRVHNRKKRRDDGDNDDDEDDEDEGDDDDDDDVSPEERKLRDLERRLAENEKKISALKRRDEAKKKIDAISKRIQEEEKFLRDAESGKKSDKKDDDKASQKFGY